MAHELTERAGLGARLEAARKNVGLTQPEVAARLTAKGHKVGKAAVSAWEIGRNVPDSIVLAHLAKLYEVTADALLWDDALSMEAVRFAVQFDALRDGDQRKFRAMWMAFFEQAKSDEEVAEHLPTAPGQAVAPKAHQRS